MEKMHTEKIAHPVCMCKTKVVSMGGYDNLFVGVEVLIYACFWLKSKSHRNHPSKSSGPSKHQQDSLEVSNVATRLACAGMVDDGIGSCDDGESIVRVG